MILAVNTRSEWIGRISESVCGRHKSCSLTNALTNGLRGEKQINYWFKSFAKPLDLKACHHITGYEMKTIWIKHWFWYELKPWLPLKWLFKVIYLRLWANKPKLSLKSLSFLLRNLTQIFPPIKVNRKIWW